MSTKIYNGYIVDLPSFYEVREFCESIRGRLEIERTKMYCRKMARNISYCIDRVNAGLEPTYFTAERKGKNFVSSYFLETKHYIEEQIAEIERTNRRNPSYDFTFSVCFIPIKDKILALMYTEHKEMTQIWEEQKEVKYYGYWNNTDPDESCTEEEWEQRYKDWEDALPGIGIPSLHGFTYNPFTLLPQPNIKQILKLVPDNEERAKLIVEEKMWTEYFEEKKQEKSGVTKITSDYFKFRDLIKGEKKEELKRRVEEMVPTMVPITKDLIFKDVEFNFEPLTEF